MSMYPQKQIRDFLIEIADDEEKRALVRKDASALIDRDEYLTDRQKEILNSGDLDKIRCAIEYESGSLPEPCWIWVVTYA